MELDHSPEESNGGSRRLVVILAAAVLILLGLIGWWILRPEPTRPEAPPATAERPSPPAAETTAPARPEEPVREAAPEARRRARPAPRPAPAPPAEPAAPVTPARELIVDTDVPGALVFLDRRFLGNAPVRTADVTSGSHQVNVSAEGFDGVAQTIDVAESGQTSVTISLKEVRLNEAVDVVHKHGMGSCQGRLTADLTGFKYVPQRGDDGFTIPLGAVETFEIDYLKKNLRIKRKGGRTWNFESPTGSADPLFVFHRDVEKARGKLAK